MSKVVLDVAMSLDGSTAGPDISAADPMGKGGERLHEWMWAAGNGPDGKVDIGFTPVKGQRGELIQEGEPVARAVTHLRYRVARP